MTIGSGLICLISWSTIKVSWGLRIPRSGHVIEFRLVDIQSEMTSSLSEVGCEVIIAG
jgi:hypothetical protein